MTRQSPAFRALPNEAAAAPARKSSPTRSTSARRARLVQEARKGRPNALRHGVFAVISNGPDVACEVALAYALHPHLDPLADRRLVEELALALVQRRRVVLAMQTEGFTAVLTSYESKLAPLSERLERAVHERDQQRAAAKGKAGAVDLSRYGQPTPEPKP